MEELGVLTSLFILFIVIWNFFDTHRMRRALTNYPEVNSDYVPPELRDEVALQIKDGYKLISIEENKVKLIKKKRYWFPLWLFFPMPNAINIIFSSSFLCNIYGVELNLIEGDIEVSTF